MILATCIDCGDVELRPVDVTLEVCVSSVVFSFHFRCPSCGQRRVRSCDAEVAALLAANGCTTVAWSIEAIETRPRTVGSLTRNDVARFTRLLADDEAFDRALQRLDV